MAAQSSSVLCKGTLDASRCCPGPPFARVCAVSCALGTCNAMSLPVGDARKNPTCVAFHGTQLLGSVIGRALTGVKSGPFLSRPGPNIESSVRLPTAGNPAKL
ncbi:hypothetical protein GGTG_10142 [Gaeumannomyces tritici R3-111a-1]|uniref:Uncharacterized protein n=1 Tax=Gaeumannomyces tritici (strain R3-111a-1) TaxID=644352 RepID=J3P9G1_GAET3|nr:hypothetical protein GGTG_10142 [Gaeumannomyces tritici R3-111a-1]EJT73297.1 hypothetical protein GGTG_10142 [Gaeumannomyces tritici R3-111a-1]